MTTKRNILLITTDQMRFDALGCNGGTIATTKNIDSLAERGINYLRAHNQNVACMPARATIITGQHVGSHGVWMNGVSMPEDRHTIAHHLKDHGYDTALFGKAHFEPWLGSPETFFENRMAQMGITGPHRGFDRMELANHFFEGHSHYDLRMNDYPEVKSRFYPMVTSRGQNTVSKGETGAVQVWPMEIPSELYHTNWVAERTISWLKERPKENPWFCWLSFPDPHHPWDVPENELKRIPWREIPLPKLYSEDKNKILEWLNQKPSHWRGYYEGNLWTNLESPRDFKPKDLTPDQILEINAITHVENELIDEACGKVIECLKTQNMFDTTDVFFTTDHGELQGDFGLLFKGPYHVDALMRVPLIWAPAPFTATKPCVIESPVGHVDLAKTFCQIANISAPEYCEGSALPKTEADIARKGLIYTEWDSEHQGITMRLRSVYHKDGFLCTTYGKNHFYDGTEGELYDMNEDPMQAHNRWNDLSLRNTQNDLIETIANDLPVWRGDRLPRLAPV